MRTNHLGERQYQTFSGWKRAILKLDRHARFDGNREICFALTQCNRFGLGEWTGDSGIVYGSDYSENVFLEQIEH